MYKLFNNILVPLNLHKHSETAIKKAVQLSAQFNCDVHLLYLVNKPFWKSWSLAKAQEKIQRLTALQDRYAMQLPRGCVLHMDLREGNAAAALQQYIAINQVDLILTHRVQRPFSFDAGLDINKLAANTGCPVLSLQTSPSLNGMRNIVLPVGEQLPLRKIMLAIYMAKDSNAAIHLITLTANNTSASKRHVYLEKAYQLLRENTSLPIQCKMVVGENLADTTLEYARKVEADLILVKAGDEGLLSGPMNRLFSKFLFNRSTIPVITVA